MSTFIILIDRNVPQHWGFAKRNGFWDLQKNWQGIGVGDTAYFWVTGTPGRVVGRARLTSNKVPLPSNTPHAWSESDTRRGDYHFRIHLTDFEDLPDVRLDWGEVRNATGAPGRLNPVTRIPDGGVPWLEQRLGVTSASLATPTSQGRIDTHFPEPMALRLEDLSPEPRGLSALTDRQAVIDAMREHNDMGRKAFLEKYGFGEAVRYVLVHSGREYDSKAIVGAALAHQPGVSAPLPRGRFSGGVDGAVAKLHELGFTVIDTKPEPDARPVADVLDGESSSPEVQAVVEAVEKVAGRRRGGQGYGLSADERRAVERRAVDVATAYLESRDGGTWSVTDVGATQSYDLDARRGTDERLYVEVKGTTGGGEEILLTKNEVDLHRSVHPNNMLAIVTGVVLDRSASPATASGGSLRVIQPFDLLVDRLTPIAYRYSV